MARMSLDELRTRASTVDRAKVDATTEAEIETHRAADGDADLDVTDGVRVVESPRALRVRLAMTQPEMAAALCIPLGTWRNWEQGRVNLEPAALALLKIVSQNPDAAFAALGSEARVTMRYTPSDIPMEILESQVADFRFGETIERIAKAMGDLSGKQLRSGPVTVASSLAGQGVNLLGVKQSVARSQNTDVAKPTNFAGGRTDLA